MRGTKHNQLIPKLKLAEGGRRTDIQTDRRKTCLSYGGLVRLTDRRTDIHTDIDNKTTNTQHRFRPSTEQNISIEKNKRMRHQGGINKTNKEQHNFTLCQYIFVHYVT